MAESNELKKIKKIYGERFMHLCRSLFPTILETEGLLTKVLETTFANNGNSLYEDIISLGEENFKNLIYSKINVEKEEPQIIENKSPYELLDEAGYVLYECTTEEEIQSFKKYYKKNERLCTFHGGRLNYCFVFWAVKKDADTIKRENFKTPRREDEYGTSVMSIQFNKEGLSTVSIKNRYNHSVNNPDATYGNDLDKIVPGLAQSFTELLAKRGLVFKSSNKEDMEFPGYVVASDGKYYKYNHEINGVYYCPGNIIIDHGKIIRLEPEKEILLDYFILNKEKKTIKLYDEDIEDSFIDDLTDIEKLEVINDKKEKGIKIITIKKKNASYPITIKIDNNNNILGYINNNITKVGNGFLQYNNKIKEIKLDNLEEVKNEFLVWSQISHIYFPKLKRAGNSFLDANDVLTEIDLPNLEKLGYCAFTNTGHLTVFKAPKLVDVDLEDFYIWSNPPLNMYARTVIATNKIKKKLISSKDIAELDKNTELTTTEIDESKSFFTRIKNFIKEKIFKDKNDSEDREDI